MADPDRPNEPTPPGDAPPAAGALLLHLVVAAGRSPRLLIDRSRRRRSRPLRPGVYQGVASGYLARHPAGSVVDGYVRAPNIPFRPPADPLTPLVMVGPGTGPAPCRGFLQERAATLLRGGRLCDALLFVGCRHAEQDFICRDEIENWAAHGIVTLHVANSRPDHGPKRYVQDAIRQEGAAAWAAVAAGGTVYVCGDGGKMEPAVRQAIADVAVAHGGIAPNAAAACQQRLADEGRYPADVWANG